MTRASVSRDMMRKCLTRIFQVFGFPDETHAKLSCSCDFSYEFKLVHVFESGLVVLLNK